MAEEKTYDGLLGSFRYSYGASDSPVYKGYVVLSALLALVVALFFALALVVLIAGTLGAAETITLVRSFFVLVGLLVVAPIIAPVLLVARRHRKRLGTGSSYDTALALGGFLFMAALYLGLVISVPSALQESTGGALGGIVAVLYGLPSLLGFVPPVLAAALIVVLHRRYR
ncbi:hypothetical protein [Halalkalicoccus subterraneus]|uniref:hypothetical protein n=1 Tax=Halalkalicoccus subterraneus TaxID=2675002 RepID=UPI000EFC0A07|nr:hypothetical protein [Halalkalicoccus subterraneus]